MSKPTAAKPTSLGKYGAVIQQARNQENQSSGEPENQLAGLPEPKEEDVNLSIKVSKQLRRHWVAEAKRRDTTLTAAIIGALKEKFGEPEDE